MFKMTTTGYFKVCPNGKALTIPTIMWGNEEKTLVKEFNKLLRMAKEDDRQADARIVSIVEVSADEYEAWKTARDAKWKARREAQEAATHRSTLDTGGKHARVFDCVAMSKVHENVLKRRS